MTTRAASHDVAVIGAGVVGLSVAEELLSAGLSVAVIDRQQAGREASWAGAGILPPGSRYSSHPAIEELAALSHPLNAQLSERLREFTGLDDGYRECGAVYVASAPSYQAEFREMFARWRTRDIRVTALGPQELADLAPYAPANLLAIAEAGHAYHAPEEAQARNPRRLRALCELVRSWGGAVLEHDEAVAIDEQPNGVTVSLASGDSVHADRVVIANGAWASRFLPPRAGGAPVRPMKGQMLLLEEPAAASGSGQNLHIDAHYLAPRTDGRVLAGATLEDAGFDKTSTASGCADLLRFVESAGLGDARLVQTWAGLRPAASDELPLIGAVTDRVYAAAGHFRAGLQFASVTAMLLRQLLLSQPTCVDASPFRIDR